MQKFHCIKLIAVKTAGSTFINFGTWINKYIEKMPRNTTTSYKIAGILKKPKMTNMNKLITAKSKKSSTTFMIQKECKLLIEIRSIWIKIWT